MEDFFRDAAPVQALEAPKTCNPQSLAPHKFASIPLPS